jgi:DNA-binding CsgD family transcriptional regulator
MAAGPARTDDAAMMQMLPGRAMRALSERELDILRCLSQGHSNKVIARQLVIAEATVKAHVKALLRKMQVANRTQAAICAPEFLGATARRAAAAPPAFRAGGLDIGHVPAMQAAARHPAFQPTIG